MWDDATSCGVVTHPNHGIHTGRGSTYRVVALLYKLETCNVVRMGSITLMQMVLLINFWQ